MKKVWYHQIWIQTYLGFIVLILMYVFELHPSFFMTDIYPPTWFTLWSRLQRQVAVVAIPFSQKLVLAIKAYLKNDVLDRPSFDQEKGVSLIFHKSMDKISTKMHKIAPQN